MIGSSTLIVRRRGKLAVHLYDGLSYLSFNLTKAQRRMDPFAFWKREEKRWGKPNDKITEAEVDEILQSDSCCSEDVGQPGYSKYCGDFLVLLDLDAKKVYGPKRVEGRKSKWTPLVTLD